MPLHPSYDPTPDTAVRLLYDAPIGVSIVKPDGYYGWVNEAFCRILEYTEGQLRHMRWIDITVDSFKETNLEEAQRLVEGVIQSYTIVKAYKKNGWRPEHPRECYGTLTVYREPMQGEFEHYWAFFVPHDIRQEDRNKWIQQLREIAIVAKDNYKWIALAAATSAALIGGNWQEVFRLMLPQSVNVSTEPSLDTPP